MMRGVSLRMSDSHAHSGDTVVVLFTIIIFIYLFEVLYSRTEATIFL